MKQSHESAVRTFEKCLEHVVCSRLSRNEVFQGIKQARFSE